MSFATDWTAFDVTDGRESLGQQAADSEPERRK